MGGKKCAHVILSVWVHKLLIAEGKSAVFKE